MTFRIKNLDVQVDLSVLKNEFGLTDEIIKDTVKRLHDTVNDDDATHLDVSRAARQLQQFYFALQNERRKELMVIRAYMMNGNLGVNDGPLDQKGKPDELPTTIDGVQLIG